MPAGRGRQGPPAWIFYGRDDCTITVEHEKAKAAA